MKKLYSLAVELRIIKTLTLEPDSRAAQAILAKVDESWFATEIARSAFKVCQKSLRKRSKLPDWDDLISNPSLDDDIREALEDCEYPALKTKEKVLLGIERLNDYRRMRMLAKIGKIASDAITSDTPVNVDEEFTKIANIQSQQRSQKNFKVLRIGKNSNSRKYVDRIMSGRAITYFPTGFEGFDKINKGFPAGSFILMASPSGRGKSGLLNQLAENMVRHGLKGGFAPLEMSNEENLVRNVARIGETDMSNLNDPLAKLSENAIEEIKAKWDKFDNKIEKLGGTLEFYEFDEDVNIEGLTSTVQPFELDFLVIDYLGLLDETSGDNQWQKLMDAARYCHVWGKANKCCVIAAAQLSDDGLLRYSKGLQEHAKYFWYWNPDEHARSTGIYKITQRKARNASDHDFYLKFDLPRMTVKDAEKDEIEEETKERKDNKTGRKDDKVSKKWEKDSSVGWGDEDDDEDDGDTIKPKPGKRAQEDVKRAGKRKTPKKDIEL